MLTACFRDVISARESRIHSRLGCDLIEDWTIAPSGECYISDRKGSKAVAVTQVIQTPKTSSNRAAGPVRGAARTERYDRLVRRILADKNGDATWAALEQLDRASAHDPLAARAMRSLEAHHAVAQFQVGKQDGSGLLEALDSACRRTQASCWKALIRRHGRESVLPLLRKSRRGAGCAVLGLPSRFGTVMTTASRGSLERLEDWDVLFERSLKRRLHTDNGDPRLKEYRRLYQAYQEVRSGRHQGKVAECSLYIDLKALEESLLPEQIEKTRQEVRKMLLGSQSEEGFHPQSTVRQLLGSLSELGPDSRESFLYRELSAVALSDPRELPYYSRMILEELKHGPRFVRERFLPRFQVALARVQSLRLGGGDSTDLPQSGKLESLLRGFAERRESQRNGSVSDGLEYFRSKLTVNGYVKNYTYL